jgi:hypothetical protein
MANAQESLRALAGFNFYAELDLKRGFDQLPVDGESARLLTFTADRRVFRPLRVSQGLSISSQHFQQIMSVLFRELIKKGVVVVFVDDVVVCSRTMEEHCNNLREVLNTLDKAGLTLNIGKCKFLTNIVTFLGFNVNASGITILKERMDAFRNITLPSTVKGMRSLLGATNFIRQFVPHYQQLAQPLYESIPPGILKSKAAGVKIIPKAELQLAFDRFKGALLEAQPLTHIDYGKPLVVQTDASDLGLGGVLLNDGVPAYFISKTFAGAELNWSTVDKEAHAIFYVVTKLEHFLLGHHFSIETDNRNITFMTTSKTPRVIRMWTALQEFSFTVSHIPGENNLIADLLSRHPSDVNAIAPLDSTSVNSTIKDAHNALVGHGGISATLQKLKDTGQSWSDMAHDVESFIAACPVCQKAAPYSASPAAPPYHTFHQIPFEALQMDHVGPFPEDDRGYKHILVVTDRCTRFTFLFPTKTKDSWEVAGALLQVVGLVGAPSVLASDQGASFTSSLIQDILQMLGCHHKLHIAYDHQHNGLIERINREVNRHLGNLVMEARVASNWSLFLPLVARILNSTVNRTTGFAPATLLFGKYSPPARFLKHPSPAGSPSLSDIATGLSALQEKFLKDAVRHQNDFVAAVATKHSKSHATPNNSLLLNGYALVKHVQSKPNKLSPRWRGPFAISSIDGAYVTLKSLIKDDEFTTHINNCKQFNVGEENPALIAALDEDEYFIDRILDQYPPKLSGPKKSWQFLVRWLGASQDEDEWLPYMSVRNTLAFGNWMQQHQQ